MKNSECEPFVKDLLYHFNPIRTEQLKRGLCKYYEGVDETKAEKVLLSMQKKRALLMSSDGWTLTKGRYVQLTDDDRYEYADFLSPVPLSDMNEFILRSDVNLKLISCLWILIDMLPYSMEFALTHKPWQLSFISGKRELYEVTYIPQEEEIVRFEMLSNLPRDLYDELKANIRRIVILEKPEHAYRVPQGVGIRFIVTLDDSVPCHYRVVEKREQAW